MRTPADIAERRAFDYEILRDMSGPAFRADGYATTADLEARRNPITTPDRARLATKYRFTFSVPTLIAAGQFAPVTEIGVDTEVVDFPLNPPNTWILSPHTPWSPHFRKGAPVCLGDELWMAKQGYITLGHLAIHIARMLNWDEKGRGAGYVGWNGEAIEYHRKHYGNRALNPALAYPALPAWIAGEFDESQPEFKIVNPYGSGSPEIEWLR